MARISTTMTLTTDVESTEDILIGTSASPFLCINTTNGNSSFFNNDTECIMGIATTSSSNSGGRFWGLEIFPEMWAAYYINFYYIKVLAAVGIPGNLLSLAVVCHMRPVTSTCVYIAVLAIVDSISLALKLLFIELTRVRYDTGLWGCKFLKFTLSTVPMYSFWILVAMTCERYIAIAFPFKASRYSTKRSAVITLCAIFIFLSGLNAHLLKFITKKPIEPGQEYCTYDVMFEGLPLTIWNWIDGAFTSYIPCIILFFCNLAIIWKIRKFLEKRKGMSSGVTHTPKQTQMTVMLVTVSVIFLIFTTPCLVFNFMSPQLDFHTVKRSTALHWLIKQIVFLLFEANHAINFFLYFLAGSKFRKKTIETVLCRKHENGSSYVVGTSVYSTTNV